MKQDYSLDVSFLSLIPREALWAELLEPQKYALAPCLKNTRARYWIEDGIQNFRIELDISVDLVLTAPEGRVQLRIAELTSDFAIAHPYQQGTMNTPLFDLMWRGGKYTGVDIGPIAGFGDRVFRSKLTDEVQNNLGVLTTKLAPVLQERKKLIIGLTEKIVDVKDAIDTGHDTLNVLFTLLYIGLDPADSRAELARDQLRAIHLLRASDLIELLISDGVSTEEIARHLRSQTSRILRRWDAIARTGPIPARKTLIDNAMATLDFIRSNLKAPDSGHDGRK